MTTTPRAFPGDGNQLGHNTQASSPRGHAASARLPGADWIARNTHTRLRVVVYNTHRMLSGLTVPSHVSTAYRSIYRRLRVAGFEGVRRQPSGQPVDTLVEVSVTPQDVHGGLIVQTTRHTSSRTRLPACPRLSDDTQILLESSWLIRPSVLERVKTGGRPEGARTAGTR